jgi:hypothetical protein
MAEYPAKTQRIYCNRCRQQTNHNLHGSFQHHETIEKETWEGWFSEDSMLYICAGCETPTLLVISEFSENPDPETEFWPPRKEYVREVKRFNKLPEHLEKIYRESVQALNSRALVLCTIGLRTLLEGICNHKKLKGDNLAKKIEGLRKFLPSGNIVKYLHGFRFSGNEAAHAMKALSVQEAKHALDVMDDLLMALYDLDYKASLLKHAKRRTRQKPKLAAKPAAPPTPSVPVTTIQNP